MKPLRAFIVALGLILWSVAALAATTGPDYESWNATAQRVEAAVEANRASIKTMEELRREVAEYRKQFLAAQSINATRINTLQSQLSALGPVPEGGEDTVIADRRAELQQSLSTAQEPVIKAEEAYNLADALINEIDRSVRERLRADFFARGPSPLNLSEWPVALEHVGRALKAFATETRQIWANGVNTKTFHDNLALIIVLTLIGGVLILRGRHWSEKLGERLRMFGGSGTRVWHTLITFGRVLLPLIGLVCLTQALVATGYLGLRGTALMINIPVWGGLILWFRWLGERVFAKNDDDALLTLTARRRAEARWYGTLLAVLIVLRSFFELLSGFERFSDQINAILFFPQVLLAGLVFFRLGQILKSIPKPEEGEFSQRSNAEWLARKTGAAMMIIGVLTPVLSAFGYAAASKGIIFPMVLSTSLMSFVLVLHRFVTDLYVWLSGKGEDARDSLVPTLAGFVLSLAALPFLALIWGARATDLYEWWLSFLRGFSIGGVTISPSGFLTFAIVFAIGYSITRLLQGTLRNTLLPKTKMDVGGQNAVVSGLGYLGIFLAAIVAISSAGIDLSSIAIVAGALSVGIGFGLQTIVSNFVSGIILLVERPVSEGDWIEVGGQMGYVRDISVRSTRIETFDRSDVIVPNSDLISGTVTNYTRGNTVGRVIVKVGVAYGTDTRQVETVLREIANAHPMVLANPAPNIVFHSFGADALEFEIRAILRDVNWVLSVKSDMNHEIAKRFAEEGFEIPFAQRDIWLRNPEVLKGGDA